MFKKTLLSLLAASMLVLGLVSFSPVYAQTNDNGDAGPQGMWGGPMMGGAPRTPGVVGQVASISGTSFVITDSRAQTTYTVDATNATITKNGQSSSFSSIAVGDTVFVQGSISGTSVTATAIRDGIVPGMRNGMMNGRKNGRPFSTTSPITGNGQPIVGGSITAINGNTITITNQSNVTYTIDATNAKVVVGNASSTIADLSTGEQVLVQGTVNGTSVTASSIIVQGGASENGDGGQHGPMSFGARFGGFFGGIGHFFAHLFGF